MSLNDSDCIPDIEGAQAQEGERAALAKQHAAEMVAHLLAGLTIPEMDVLRDWKAKFEGKYFKVGKVVKG